MANFPSKKNVNVAASKRNKFDLTKQVVTTHDFGRMKAIECRYMVPGDNFNVKVSSFTRLLPMSAPTFGRIDCIQRAFFVPIRTIFPNFYDMVRNRPVQANEPYTQYTPHVFQSVFQRMFVQSDLSTFIHDATTPPPARNEYDFYWPGHQQSDQDGYYKFTTEGRRIYDFLTSMGLNISFDAEVMNLPINILPLVAFWKFYYDWIVPSRFIENDEYNIYRFLDIFIKDESYNASHVQYNDLRNYLCKIPYSYYKDDYFNSAWRNADHSDDTPATSTFIPNPGFVTNQDQDSPALGVSDANLYDIEIPASGSHVETLYSNDDVAFINQYTIESLGKLQDYLNRGMLAGSKIQDWLATEFGMRPNSDAIGLSTYLGKFEDTIKIGDIASTADTVNGSNGVALGAYAGIAKGASVGNFSFEAKGEDHGYFFITTEIIPKTSYFEGLTPEFSMIDRLDFFQPEFDNMGCEAVMQYELYNSPRKLNGLSPINSTKIFGYTPHYSKLKTAFDVVSGDFRNRFGELLKPWYLARSLEKWFATAQAAGIDYINPEFCKVISDYQNWDYMFNDSESGLDHFYQIFLIENNAYRPMLSVADALNPEHPNGNKSVTVNTNGSIE